MLHHEKLSKIPSWVWVEINYKKKGNYSLLMKYEFVSVYEEHLKIYTDWSKICGLGVGCSAVVPEFDTEITKPLSKESTVFEAEIKAIESALEWVFEKISESDQNRNEFLICSNSKSPLQSLMNPPPKKKQPKDEVHKYYSSILKIVEIGVVIQFLWCPAHVGVMGNEKSHKYAKKAAQNLFLTPHTEPYIQIREMVRRIYQKILRK